MRSKSVLGALALACFAPPPVSADGPILTPSVWVVACQIATGTENTVLAAEPGIVAGKQVVRTGAISIIANVAASNCPIIGGVVTTIHQSRLVTAPVLIAP